MEEMNLITMISQVGFPIAVAAYCLLVLNKTMTQVSTVMEKICFKLGVDNNDAK